MLAINTTCAIPQSIVQLHYKLSGADVWQSHWDLSSVEWYILSLWSTALRHGQHVVARTVTGVVVCAQQLEQLCGLGRYLTDKNLAVVLQVLLRLQHTSSQRYNSSPTPTQCSPATSTQQLCHHGKHSSVSSLFPCTWSSQQVLVGSRCEGVSLSVSCWACVTSSATDRIGIAIKLQMALQS